MKLFVCATGLLVLGFSVALALGHVVVGQEPASVTEHVSLAREDGSGPNRGQERYLYVATIAQSQSDPDFVMVVGADPLRGDFGRIVNRIDMPNVGDELHHFGYSLDQERLIVPGLFSNRMQCSTFWEAEGTCS